MTFAEKLNFLMDITKTSNSTLAHSVALDASYISRLRTGKRLIPKDSRLIQGIATFLARRFKEDYQKKALFDSLKLVSLPGDINLLADDITRWLTHDGEDGVQQVGQFLSRLSGITGRQAAEPSSEVYSHSFPDEPLSIYYGIEGKRRAAEYFLSEVAACETPQTLLLFSDEGTAWMTEDPAYARRWAELMACVLARGNRIKIIHTISRDLDEMLSAISQWMPLYMSGSIEPYFYPKKRDGIFKRTLFIAPATAAVISNSVGDQISSAANVLYRDRDAVASFAEEFLQYLRLCRPLMRIFTVREREECYATLTEFERGQADTLIRTESLSLLTMPEHLLTQMLRRSDMDQSSGISNHKVRYQCFLENLQSNHFTELIFLPDVEAVKSGSVKVSMSDMLGGGAVYYTPEEFVAHLKHILALLESFKNYHIHLIDKPTEDRYTVYAREEFGVIVAKTSQPPVVLAINESNMTAAFWDFLKSIIGEKTYGAEKNADSIAVLRNYLGELADYTVDSAQ